MERSTSQRPGANTARHWNPPDLRNHVAVVAGATRGAGRAIAVTLGECGATVYATGRSTRGHSATKGRPETIEETAELIDTRGGKGIAVRVDHTIEDDVRILFARVSEEQQGRLDLLVNDVWGGDELTNWQQPFWEHSLRNGLTMQERAVWSHIITASYGAPLLVARGRGLLVEVTDGTNYDYRGNLFYSLAKISAIHLAAGMATDLRRHGVTALAVTPGFLRSEAMLDHFGVKETNWRDGIARDPFFAGSETPYYLGRAVAMLAGDPNVATRSGQTLSSWDLAEEYGFPDVDGAAPHWGRFFAERSAQSAPV